MNQEISPANWNRLYGLAKVIHRLAPWEWMLEMDLFGVAHPLDGTIGYCSIQGPSKEGLAVYKGLDGLDSYKHLYDGDDDHPSLSVIYEQDCLAMFFVHEKELYEEEKQLLTKYNKSGDFGGKYPVFRDYSPGWAAWPIQEGFQSIWLEVALTQAIDVASRFRLDPDLLDHMSNNEAQILVRKPIKSHFREEWTDEWMPIEVSTKDPSLNKELYIRSNCSDLPRQEQEWFATLFYDSALVEDESKRPYLPLLAIVADSLSGKTIYQKKFKPGEEEHFVQHTFVQACKKKAYIPKKLKIGSEKDFKQWQYIGKVLDIPVELDKDSRLERRLKDKYLGQE